MKAVETQLAKPRADDARLIKLAAGAKILGVSPDAIRKRSAPRGVERLTIIDGAKNGAQRRLLFLIYSEVIELRDELIHNARQRMDMRRVITLVNG